MQSPKPQQPCELAPAKLLPDRVQVCFICGTSTTRPRSGLRIDAKMVRPCFCDCDINSASLATTAAWSNTCKRRRYAKCVVLPIITLSYFLQYGSLKDFFVRYWCQYFASFVALVLLFLLSALALTNSLRKVDTFSLARLFILIIGIVLFGLCLIFTWMCVKYTVMRRIPRFHARYRQITVLDYEPRQTPQVRVVVFLVCLDSLCNFWTLFISFAYFIVFCITVFCS
ncbi:hypothetical protein OESDEN_18380 [Oesophagostomum dentatum]|uniref:Uncharacterized protein n=1 Tax=Oesophagostomum dentatum TaxID=61180 RepID=A0A0B1SDF4_OESDE|nr:hypothetical protein OESDEN_18380 [Oesophagostomum dentatum]